MKATFLTRFFCSSTLLCLASSLAVSAVQAQSSCSSDQQPVPTALLERFISADCSDCWATSTLPAALKGQVSLDWIVPSPRGDEAPLSAAAINDATSRLQALQLSWPTAQAKLQNSDVLPGPLEKPASTLRVAHGLPVNGYIGTSIEFKPSASLRQTALGPKKLSSPSDVLNVQAYVVLVETLPAGTEGSQVERHLVRNMLEINWNLNDQLSRTGQAGFKPLFESRPLSIPQGVNPDRLRVLGWVQSAKDAQHKGLPSYQARVLAMAQSRCKN